MPHPPPLFQRLALMGRVAPACLNTVPLLQELEKFLVRFLAIHGHVVGLPQRRQGSLLDHFGRLRGPPSDTTSTHNFLLTARRRFGSRASVATGGSRVT